MCQYLGYNREILHLGFSVGGSEEWQVVQEVGNPSIFGFRNLAHPCWIISGGLHSVEVSGVGCGGEDIEEEPRWHRAKAPN